MALREREKITLIGRRNELGGILALLDPGPQRIPLIAIGGPGGIGKSALASEVGRIARSKGYQVAVARCRDGSPYPYAAFRDLIEGLNESVTSVNPFLDERAKNSKDGILIAFESFLSRWSKTDPLLIVLEDLQQADSSTLRLLSYLIRSIKEGGVRFICTFCQEEAVVDEKGLSIFNEFVSGAMLDGVCRTVVLGGLQPDEIAKLISGRFQLNLPKNVVDKVSKTCHGNPLLAIESIRSIDSAGSMELRDGVLRCDRLGPLPMTFEETVKNRLGDLNALQLKMLFRASTFEKNRDLNDLAVALEAGPDDVASIIEEVHRKSDLIDRIGYQYFFPHERVRGAIRDLIPPQDKKATHGSVAKALKGNEYPEECLGELSMHWLQAEDSDKCINFSVRAGRTCAAWGAHLESALYFGRALRLVEGTGQRDVLLESCESMGDANLGLDRKDAAMVFYDKAMRHSSSSDRARLLRKKSNCVGHRTGEEGSDASLSLILQGLIEAGDEYETAECKSGIASSVMANGDVDGAEKLCLAAMKVFRDRGMVDRLADEMMQYGDILLRVGRVDQAIDILDQAVRTVNEHPNLGKEMDGTEALAMAYLYKGEVGRANLLLDRCLEISRRLQDGKRTGAIQLHKTFASDLIRDVSKSTMMGAEARRESPQQTTTPGSPMVVKANVDPGSKWDGRSNLMNAPSNKAIDPDIPLELATGTLEVAINASLLSRKMDYGRSDQLFQEALDNFRGKKFGPLYEATVRAWYAESLAEQGRTEKALEEYRRSRSLFEGFGNSLITRILDRDIDHLASAKAPGNEDS